MKRVINFVKGRRDDRRDHKFVNSPICVEITNPSGQKVQSEDEHILGLQSGYGYQVDLNGKDKNMTKLHKAAWQGNLDKVKMQLKKADVNSVDHSNRTALHFAVAQGHANVAFFLLGAEAQLNLRDSDGMTPFLKAVECGNKECIHTLLEQGADVNIVDKNGNTGLHLSSKLGFLNISSLLLVKGANVNMSNNVGELALHLATEGEHRELVALLLCAGAHVNAIDREHRTPLMLAARYGHAAICALLLENGASLDACDSNGWTAEDYALIGGHQALAVDLKAKGPAREQLNKQMEEVVNANSSDENANNELDDRTIREEDDVGIANEEKGEKKEEGETVESPRSCITPPPLQPPRSWDLIQAGMIDEKEVQRRSLTTLGTLRSRRESFNENSNNNNNNGGSSPNQANDDLEKITDIVKTVQIEGLVDDESSGAEENLPLDRDRVRRGKVAPLERTPSLDLTLTDEDLTRSKESKGSVGGTLGREDTLQGYEEMWEKNANVSQLVDTQNNNKSSDVNEVLDTGQLTTDISEQLVQRNREINTAVGYVTNEIYRIMIEKNEYQSDSAEKVVNTSVHTSSSLDNLDDRKQPRFIEMESSRSCDNLDNRYITLEEKLCSGIYSAETLDTEPSLNDNEGTQSLDNLDESSPVGTVIKRNMHREVQSLDTLDDCCEDDQCCRPIKKHSRNKSVSVGQHGWSKSVDALSKPSNIDRIQIDTKKIDAQLECYDEALRELAQVELMKRNSSDRSSGDSRSGASSSSNRVNKPSIPPPPPQNLTGDIPYFSEVVSSSSQKSREYFMKPKDESDFSINQDSSPLPKILDKSGSVDGLLDMDRMSTSVEITSIKTDSKLNQSENDSICNHDLPPPPPPPVSNEMFETDLHMNLETLPGDLENENVVVNGKVNGMKVKTDDDTDDSDSKRAREVENHLYKLEKDLYNINMSAIMKPRTTDFNQNGIVTHQDIVVANGEMPPFDNMRRKVFEKGVKQTSFPTLDSGSKGEDSLSPAERSAGEDSPQVPPRFRRSLRKGKSESEVWKVRKADDDRAGRGHSKLASVLSDIEAMFEGRPSKGRKKSAGSGEIQEKSESDSELCERPLRRKRKMLLAMRGLVPAGSKDSDDDDDTSTGDPPFWLSTDKGGHFARQDTVMATQPTRMSQKSQNPPGCTRASQSGDRPPNLDKDWTSSDADTASGSDEVVIGNTFSLGSHQKLLKEHLRQATAEKTSLEETVAALSEREERLLYELADARQALSARQDAVHILQTQAQRMEQRYSAVIDELQTLRHSLTSAEVELKHLRQLCDKLAMEKADALEELSRLRDDSNPEQNSVGVAENRKTSFEAKPEQMQILQRQKQEAERRNDILVNHLEEAMRQCESARSEKDALTRQNITDIKKLQQDTLLWKERYEDCLARLERIEAECQPRLFEAQRTIDALRASIKQLQAEKQFNQDNWKAKVMDEIVSRMKKNQNASKLLPKSSCDKRSSYLGSSMKKQGSKYRKCRCTHSNSSSCDCRGVVNLRKNSIPNKVYDGKANCYNKFCNIYDAAQINLDKEYLSKLSLLLDHNRKLLEHLFTAKKEKDCIRNELCEIRKNIECDLRCRLDPPPNDQSPNGSLDESRSDRETVKESINGSDLMRIERKYYCLSKVRTILSKEEFEVEGILRSIQEVGKDLENILNNLQAQIVLVRNLNQFENSELENESNDIPSQNSTINSASNEETCPIDRCAMRFLVKELVEIRRDLLYLHGESQRISKMLQFIFKQNRNGDFLSDELKNTTECVHSCSKQILKLNSDVLKMHKIIQTLMIEFSKSACKCSGSYDDNRKESNILTKTKPSNNQNRNDNSSKENYDTWNEVRGQNCPKSYYVRDKDPPLCQRPFMKTDLNSVLDYEQKCSSGENRFRYDRKNVEDDKKQLDNMKEKCSNRKQQNDNFGRYNGNGFSSVENSNLQQNMTSGWVIDGASSSRSLHSHSSAMRNSSKFSEVRQHFLYNSEANNYLTEGTANNDEKMRQELGGNIPASDSEDYLGNKKYSEEMVIVNSDSVQISGDGNSSILFKVFDLSLDVDKFEREYFSQVVIPQDTIIDSNKVSGVDYTDKYIKIFPQSSSQEIIYLKKALTNKSSNFSHEFSQDRLPNSGTIVRGNTTNSELVDPQSRSQAVSIEGCYLSEPVFSPGERDSQYRGSYLSSSDLDYNNYSKHITTESVPDSSKPCENEQKSIYELVMESSDALEQNWTPVDSVTEGLTAREIDKSPKTTLNYNNDNENECEEPVAISNDTDSSNVSSNKESSIPLSSTNILPSSTSNLESKGLNREKIVSNDPLQAKDCSTIPVKLNLVDYITQQFDANSNGTLCAVTGFKENENNKCNVGKTKDIQKSFISVGVQTNGSVSDPNECETLSVTGISPSRESVIDKFEEIITKNYGNSDIPVNPDTSNQTSSEKNYKLVNPKSKCDDTKRDSSNYRLSDYLCGIIKLKNRPVTEAESNYNNCKSNELNEVDNNLRESERDPERSVSSDHNENYKKCSASKKLDAQNSKISIGLQTSDLNSCPTPPNSVEEYRESMSESERESKSAIISEISSQNLSDVNCEIEHSESKCADLNESVPDCYTQIATTSDYQSSSGMNTSVEDTKKENTTKSGRIHSSDIVFREDEDRCELLKNVNDQKSCISVGVQTKERTSDLKDCTSPLVLEIDSSQKSLVSIREINGRSEILIGNGTSDGSNFKPDSESGASSASGVSQPCESDIQKSLSSLREIHRKSEIIVDNDLKISENNCKSESEKFSGILQSCERETQKSRSSIRKVVGKRFSEKNCQTDFKEAQSKDCQTDFDELEEAKSKYCPSSCNLNNRFEMKDVNSNCGSRKLNSILEIEEVISSDDCGLNESNEDGGIIQESQTDPEEEVCSDIASRDIKDSCCAPSDQADQQSKDAEPTTQHDCILEECPNPSGSQIPQATVANSKITTRKMIKRTEYLNNKSTSDRNSSDTTQSKLNDSSSDSRQGALSVSICNCSNGECSSKQNSNDKSKKSCFKHLSTCLKRQNSATPKNNDKQINFLLENITLDPRIFSEKCAFSKLMPVEKSLALFFKSNLTDSYSLDDFKSNLTLGDWRLNPFLERKMAKQLFDLSLSDSSLSSENPLEEENKLSHVQIYADLKSPILIPRINVPTMTSSKDVLEDIGQKLPAAALESTADLNLQAVASTSNHCFIHQHVDVDADAIHLQFQQVENLECPDTYETTKKAIVNDVNMTTNGFQGDVETGRMRQQALLESETNLSAKIAEINSVLHQQLVEQDRRRAHNEMHMKKQFELTRHKLLTELAKVQTALKAKEAEEKALREKYEKLSRDVEKTAEIKRKQLIEKSYSLNLAHPSTMWEKELSMKRAVVQGPMPPPPPPMPPPDLPPADDRFSHLSLRAQLHHSITKHRSNAKYPSQLANLATNCNSQLEDVASESSANANASSDTSSGQH
ncbi:uncharacterized protein LOC111046376 isoform X2 [Nilaparvata lugens]|uniref:uncharacterized protein LOC111046376 isoform X2 n=1 Tax=Nilaparvata lugens TaxID=108931 RepID=UPI00193CE351|nr:uncharacterized protein LOC111046376 isoform X2 [Nilaparvata lugens]